MSPIAAMRLTGAAALLLATALSLVTPQELAQLPGGMRTPVLALELARSPAEVDAMLGPAPAQQDPWRAGLRLGTWLDYALLLAYGALLASAARALDDGPARRPELRAAFVLALIASAADALENLWLLEILSAPGAAPTRALTLLAWSTWAKWLALGVCGACLAPTLFRRGKLASAAAVAGVVALLSVAPAYLWRGLYAEVMLAAVVLLQLALWLWSLRVKTAPVPSSASVAHTR